MIRFLQETFDNELTESEILELLLQKYSGKRWFETYEESSDSVVDSQYVCSVSDAESGSAKLMVAGETPAVPG